MKISHHVNKSIEHTVKGDSNDLGQLETLRTNKSRNLLKREGLLEGGIVQFTHNLDVKVVGLDDGLWNDTTNFLVSVKGTLGHFGSRWRFIRKNFLIQWW